MNAHSNVILLPSAIGGLRPVRLQLSRQRGVKLQKRSQEINGLPAAVVGRPTRWSNPFRVGGRGPQGVATAAEAVQLYRIHLLMRLAEEPDMLEPIRKKNLACWCALDQPCHADVLLDFANR